MKAWVFQDPKQVKKVGADAASWYVGFFDPEGKKRCKSYGPGAKGKRLAEKECVRVAGQLLDGTYQDASKKTWEDFQAEYAAKILSGLEGPTRRLTEEAMAHFARIVKPLKMAALKTQAVDAYRAQRRTEPGKRGGETVSPATVNKELRHLRAVLRKAFKWGYLPKMPDFEFEREFKKLPRYVTGEHFAALYQAAGQARMPADLPFPAADWWRGLLAFAYMTGWRISEVLSLRRADLDLDAGEAVTRARDNKGKRDERVKLHPVLVEHLAKVPSFDALVFPWNHDRRTLYVEFAFLQTAAGIHLPCHQDHEHTPACHLYGFHDLRRAFATMNARRLSADALQALMRHKSYLTTQRYINMTRQLDEAVDVLYVPDVLRQGKVVG